MFHAGRLALVFASLWSASAGADALSREFDAQDKACQKGNAAACVSAGEKALYGIGTSKDPVLAASLLRRACVPGGPTGGCGGLVSIAQAVGKTNPALARQTTEDACAAGEGVGCDWLVLQLDSGAPGFPQDKARARALRLQRCMSAMRAAPSTRYVDLGAMAGACLSFTSELVNKKTPAERVAAVQLSILAALLQMEMWESSWAASDQAALKNKQRTEALAEMIQRANEEREQRNRTIDAILGGLQAGMSSVQPLIQQQAQLRNMGAAVVRDARAYQQQQRVARYQPPPPAVTVRVGAGTMTYHDGRGAPVAAVRGPGPLPSQQQPQPQPQPAAAQRQREEALKQCLAERVPSMHVTQTSEFPALRQFYERIVERAQSCPATATNNGTQGRHDWLACMNGMLWDEPRRNRVMHELSERFDRVARFLPQGTHSCALYDTDLRRYCDVMSRDNCIQSLKYAVKLLECFEGLTPKLFTAEDARNDEDRQHEHDKACNARFP